MKIILKIILINLILTQKELFFNLKEMTKLWEITYY